MNDKKMLEIYRSTSGYTIRTLESAIVDLKAGISNGEFKPETVEMLKERLGTLEYYLSCIEADV